MGSGLTQQVDINASNHAYVNSFVGNVAGGTAGIGIAGDFATIARTTYAYATGSTINSLGAVNVNALATQGISSLAVGGAGGVGAAFAGTGVLAQFQSVTEAGLINVDLDAGSLTVEADSEDDMYLVAGGAAFSGVGAVGGAFSVGLNNSTTRAYIKGNGGRSDLSVTGGDIRVLATSSSAINNYAIGAAGAGAVGVAGAVVVNIVTSTTEATVEKTDIGDRADYAGSVTIAASNEVDIFNRAGAGAGGVKAGFGAGAVVNVLKSRTIADLSDSAVYTSGALDITADSASDIDSLAVMVGVGGAGIGGGANVNLIGDNLTTEDGKELDKDGSGSLSKVDDFTKGDRFESLQGADDTVVTSAERDRLNNGAKGDVKDIAKGDDAGQLQYQTGATIGSNVTVDAGSLTVSASDISKIRAITGTGGGGLLGIGGAVTTARLSANINALVDDSSDILTAVDITISATAGDDSADAIDIEAWAGSLGIVGLGAAVTHATVDNIVNAGLAGTVNAGSGTAKVIAHDNSRINAESWGAQLGAATAGAVVARSIKQSDVNASISDSVTAGNASIEADSHGKVYALTQAAAGGVFASGVGADARAEDRSDVSAATASGTSFTLDEGELKVAARATPQVTAKAEGVNASLGDRVGVSNAFATARPTVAAYLAGNNTVTVNNLSISASAARPSSADTAKAISYAAGGGLILGVDATRSDARSLVNVESYVGNNSTLTISGKTSVNAVGNSRQYAQSDGYNGGILALGFNTSNAESDSSVSAFLGTGVDIEGGDLGLYAGGTDTNFSKAISGAGGLIGGASVKAYTDTVNDTQAYIANGVANRDINVGNLTIEANHTSNFDSRADAYFGSVFGGSGGFIDNDSSSVVSANIGAGLDITATSIDVDVVNKVNKTHYGTNIITGSGGVVDAPAAKSITDIDLVSRLTIGDGSSLSVIGDPRDPQGNLSLDVYNDVDADDSVKVDSGGAVAVAKGVSKIYNDVNDTRIEIGNADLYSVGDLSLATHSTADVDAMVRVKTYGVAGVPAGETLARVDANNDVHLKPGADLRAAGDIYLLSGRNRQGHSNRFNVDADTRGWNNTLIPISQKPKADAKLTQANRITLDGGSRVAAVRDVHLLASNGSSSVDGDGVIKDVILSEIATFFSKLFGGDSVSIEKTGGSSSNSGSAGVTNNGIVRAGTQNKQYLTIRKDGSIDLNDPFGLSEGITYTLSTEDLSDKIQQDIDLYTQYRDAFIVEFPDVGAAYQAEIDRLTVQKNALSGVNDTVDIFYIDGIWAQSGNIEVGGNYLSGSGTLEAPGDALIQIINHSPAFVQTDWLTIPEHNGGAITFNGRRVASNADIGGGASFSSIITASNSAQSLIHVENTYNPNAPGNDPNHLAPDLFIAGDIYNLEGTIELYNKAGSVNINGNLLADTLDIQAGKDIVLSYVDGARHLGGAPQALLNEIVNQSERNRVARYLNVDLDTGGTVIAANNIYASAKILNINGLVQSGIADFDIDISANPEVYEDYQSEASGFNTLAWAQQDYQDKLAAGEAPDAYYQINTDSNIVAYYNAAEDRIELEEAKVQGGYMQLYGQIISTGGGKLKVLDGYGRINVNNDSGLDLVVNALDAGVGVEGTIKITDTSFRNSADKPLTTIYKRLGNQIAVFDNETVDQYGEANRLVRTGIAGVSTDAYSPLANLSYSWSNRQTTNYEQYAALDVTHRDGNINGLDTAYGHDFWLFGNDWYGTAGEIISEMAWYCLDSSICNGRPLPIGDGSFNESNFYWDYRRNDNNLSVGWQNVDSYWYSNTGAGSFYTGIASRGTVDDPDGIVLGVSDTPAQFSSGLNYAYRVSDKAPVVTQDWEYEKTTGSFYNEFYSPRYSNIYWADVYDRHYTVETYHQHIVKADHAIGIEFSGYDSGLLNVRSAGDVLINGPLSNRNALTHVETQGAIRQLSNTAVVSGRDINLLAQSGIGADNAVRTRLNGGLIDVNSIAGDINIVDSGEQFHYKRLTTGNGNVSLDADNNILPFNTASLIRGNTINLTSEQGSIGLSGNIVSIDTGAGDNHSLTAQASTGIYLQEVSGDLRLVSAIAEGGDVSITVPGGSILDANTSEQSDVQTEQELLALWDEMKLRGIVGQDEETNAAETIMAFENTRTSDYHLYWRYRQLQSDPSVYDTGFVVTISAEERQVLLEQGLTSSDINNMQQQRTDNYHALHGDFGGLGNAYDSGFVYIANVAERKEISDGSVWSDDQLTYGIAEGVLKETSDTEARIEDANVKGINVELVAAGGLGIATGEVVIDMTPDVVVLTDAQKIALAAAESDDVTTTETEIHIALREDIDVDATGAINIVAGDHIFLGSEVDLNVDQIAAGQTVEIKTGQGIYNAATSGVDNIAGTDFLLEAALGNIGSAVAPLQIKSLGNTPLTARSGQDIYIASNNDLLVETLYAPGHIHLSGSSIFDVLNTDDINIRSHSLHLVADIAAGDVSNYLDVALDSDGLLTADITGGTGNALSILSPDRGLTLGDIDAGGDVDIEVRSGDLLGQGDIDITNSTNGLSLTASVSMDLQGNIAVDNGADLQAGLDIAFDQLDADGAVDVNAENGDITISGYVRAGGNVAMNAGSSIYLNQLQATGFDTDLTAGVDIRNIRSDNEVMLEGNNFTMTATTGQVGAANRYVVGDSNGEVNIAAATGIYYEERPGDLVSTSMSTDSGPIVIKVSDGSGYFNQITTTGDVNVGVSGDALNINTVNADSATFAVESESGQLNITDLFVKTRLQANADYMDLPNVQHTGTVDKLRLNLSGNDGGVADDINIVTHSLIGEFYEQINVEDLKLHFTGDKIELTGLQVSGLATITTPAYTIVIDEGPPKFHPEADIQLDGSVPVNLLLSSSSNLAFTNALIVHYRPDFIVNAFSTENSLSRLGEKRNAQQINASDLLLEDGTITPSLNLINEFSEFFDVTGEGTIIYDPQLLFKTTDDQVFNHDSQDDEWLKLARLSGQP
ncbi:MAG: hypothetical protein OQL16_00240 [Gammaproteobacteria bacterium]|nr:hypothetical protein [Gammaproteobacteria bacterium]